MGAVLEEGEQKLHPVVFVALGKNGPGEALHRSGNDLNHIARLHGGLEGEDVVFGRGPSPETGDQGIFNDGGSIPDGDHGDDIRGVTHGAVKERGIELAEKVAGEERAYDRALLPTDDTLLAQPGEIGLKSELRVAVRCNLTLLQRFGVETIPVHEWGEVKV